MEFEWVEQKNSANPEWCAVDICPNLCGLQVCWEQQCGSHYCVFYVH